MKLTVEDLDELIDICEAERRRRVEALHARSADNFGDETVRRGAAVAEIDRVLDRLRRMQASA